MSKELKIWLGFLLVIGILTGIVFLAPILIMGGFWLLFIPGMILYVAPSLFFYSLILTVLIFVLRPVGQIRWAIAPLLIALSAFYIPHRGNQETYKRVAQLTQLDIDVTSPIELRSTVALIRSTNSSFRRVDDHQCDRLCQRLLYNGAAERVLIGTHRKRMDNDFIGTSAMEDISATAYFIEKRNACPPFPKAMSTVGQRILLGECLLSEEATLAEAETIYVTEHVAGSKRYKLSARHDLEAVAVSANRKRVIEKTGKGYKTLFQKTETTAEPLLSPLFYSGIGHGGGSLQMSLGFLRRKIVQNNLQGFAWNEEPRIFGAVTDAVKAPFEESSIEARALVERALLSRGPDKQVGHDFFLHYLASFTDRNLDRTPGQDLTPTQEDIDIVVLALKDKRLTDGFTGLWDFNEKLELVPDELIEAMANRILSTPDQKGVVRTLSISIGALPEGKAAIISEQILEVFQHDELGPVAWKAVARLGDGDPDAAKRYASVIQTWYNKNKARKRLNLDDLSKGSLMGLCLMREKTFQVKDDLLQILRDTENGRVSYPIIKILVNAGAVADLRREYERTERWERVLNASRVKKMYEDNNRKFCNLS